MTDSALSLLEWVEAFIETLPTDLHPIGQQYLHETAHDFTQEYVVSNAHFSSLLPPDWRL